jgi:hypothetical protein
MEVILGKRGRSLNESHPLFDELKDKNAFQNTECFKEEDMKKIITEVFQEWKEEAPSIAGFFKNRDRKQARGPMVYHLSRFLQILFLGNGRTEDCKSGKWEQCVGQLPVLPVNAVERLSFIFEQPDHYHSYIQLSELFTEWEKKCVIYLRRKT